MGGTLLHVPVPECLVPGTSQRNARRIPVHFPVRICVFCDDRPKWIKQISDVDLRSFASFEGIHRPEPPKPAMYEEEFTDEDIDELNRELRVGFLCFGNR